METAELRLCLKSVADLPAEVPRVQCTTALRQRAELTQLIAGPVELGVMGPAQDINAPQIFEIVANTN